MIAALSTDKLCGRCFHETAARCVFMLKPLKSTIYRFPVENKMLMIRPKKPYPNRRVSCLSYWYHHREEVITNISKLNHPKSLNAKYVSFEVWELKKFMVRKLSLKLRLISQVWMWFPFSTFMRAINEKFSGAIFQLRYFPRQKWSE